jgi:hypothetical protein
MKLSAPKKVTWWIATIIAAVDLLMVILAHLNIIPVPFLMGHKFLIMLIAFGLLWLGTFVKGI